MSYLEDAPMEHPTHNQSRTAPTLFIDYDGTLHSGQQHIREWLVEVHKEGNT
jgi:ribonucleotide monophosphatase NagD (HAD superfamily)